MSDKKEKLQKYAKLAVQTGVNIGKGDILVVNSPVECMDFTRLIVAEGYKAGASEVVVHWSDEVVARDRYLYGADEVFKEMPNWQVEAITYYADKGAAFLSISASDPTLLKDADPTRVANFQALRRQSLKSFYERITSNMNRWSVISIPTIAWAKKVFPNVSEEQAIEKLWEAIFSVTRVNTPDPVAAWNEHNSNLKKKLEFLNSQELNSLHYKNSIGTDVVMKLAEGHIWVAGGDKDINGKDFIANMPTEEVFSMPDKYGVDGWVASSKPLAYNGNLIENFKLRFEKGAVVEYSAEKGEETLKRLLETDDGAKRLGEVALVPYDSPISNSGITFFNTLYDENASCHFAFGEAYSFCIKGGTKMSKEEKDKNGVNTSLTHVDFMLGTSDLDIVGEKDGKKIQIFKNGNWAF